MKPATMMLIVLASAAALVVAPALSIATLAMGVLAARLESSAMRPSA